MTKLNPKQRAGALIVSQVDISAINATCKIENGVALQPPN